MPIVDTEIITTTPTIHTLIKDMSFFIDKNRAKKYVGTIGIINAPSISDKADAGDIPNATKNSENPLNINIYQMDAIAPTFIKSFEKNFIFASSIYISILKIVHRSVSFKNHFIG
jgi:hypothetical protein